MLKAHGEVTKEMTKELAGLVAVTLEAKECSERETPIISNAAIRMEGLE
jgi:hypothetical protein